MIRLREWKYEEGAFSYGQRIAVGQIFADETRTEYQRMKAAWRELYGWNARLMPVRLRARMFERMLDGLRYWVELEQQTLKHEPTAEQRKAGIVQMMREVGEMGTIKAVAKAFGQDPDAVLRWEWAKVYGILRTDLLEYEFNERLAEQARRAR